MAGCSFCGACRDCVVASAGGALLLIVACAPVSALSSTFGATVPCGAGVCRGSACASPVASGCLLMFWGVTGFVAACCGCPEDLFVGTGSAVAGNFVSLPLIENS